MPDVYVLVDGDATYDARAARLLVARLVEGGLDMVVGARRDQEQAAYRFGHRFGNRVLTGFRGPGVRRHLRGPAVGLPGVFPALRQILPRPVGRLRDRDELTVHALNLELPVDEIETPYFARPEGSVSKLSTWRDGLRILRTIVRPLPRRAAAAVLLRDRAGARRRVDRAQRSRSSSPMWSRAWSRAFQPPCCSTGLMILACLAVACGIVSIR